MWERIPVFSYFYSVIGVSGAIASLFCVLLFRHARGFLPFIGSCLDCFCHSDLTNQSEVSNRLEEVVALKVRRNRDIETDTQVEQPVKVSASKGFTYYKQENKPLCVVKT